MTGKPGCAWVGAWGGAWWMWMMWWGLKKMHGCTTWIGEVGLGHWGEVWMVTVRRWFFSEANYNFLGMHSMDVNRPLTRWLIDNVESARDRLAKSEPIRYEVKTMTSPFSIA